MQEALLSEPVDPNASQEVHIADASHDVVAGNLQATDFDRAPLLWDPLSDLSWPRAEEVNWEREVVLELRRVTSHLQNL